MNIRKPVLLGSFAVFAVGVVTYYSASRIGFLNNDWYYLELLARKSLPQYLLQYFDPRLQTGWYRPIFGVLYLIVYTFWGADPVAHHLAHVLLHATTAALYFVLVEHFSRNIRIALIAGLVYVGLPVYSKAVYWPSVPDPLSMSIYLMAIWFWVAYLETGGKRYAVATFIAFVLDVMTKETSVTLPIVLFLVDRLCVGGQSRLGDLARRYVPYVLGLLIYVLVEYAIQHNGSYVNLASYGVGSHMISNLIDGMALVAFPWELGAPAKYIWLGVATIGFVTTTAILRSKKLAFLGIFALLNLLPMVGFPPEWFETRYLYVPTMASAVLIACLIEVTWTLLGRHRPISVAISGAVVLILFVNQSGVNGAVADWGEVARQRRTPFREISQNHPSFPEDTYLYFLESRTVPVADLSVMFLLRYGKGVTVEGSDDNQIARIHDYPVSYVYYFDETGHPVEVRVDRNVGLPVSPQLPVDFQVPIRLEGYDFAQNTGRRDGALVLLLYWRALRNIEKDYTIFVHLVDETGQVVAGYDTPPRDGLAPTSTWKAGRLVVDPHLLRLGTDLRPGKYRLEVGLYYLPTLERVSILNDQAVPTPDPIVFGPLQVLE